MLCVPPSFLQTLKHTLLINLLGFRWPFHPNSKAHALNKAHALPVRLVSPHGFKTRFGESFCGFSSSPSQFFSPSSAVPVGPLPFPFLHVFSFLSTLQLYSHISVQGGVICKGGLDGSFFTRGGLLQLGLLPALRERKNHLFFLSMYLYLFLNVVSCVLMLSEFNIGYKVFLRVALWKNMLRFRLKGKLTPIFIGPFEILQRIRPVAYKVDLSP